MPEPDQLTPGRRAIAEAIRGAGITTVFTMTGGHFLPTYHELGRLEGVRVVAARHELGAGYMASGFALTTGRPGVVFTGAPGPGATNVVTAVANAQADSIPLLVLTGQVDQRYVHRNVLQHCDNVGLLAPFCKQSLQANSVAELPSLFATGLQLAASGRPGPVHVALPQNLQAESAPPTTAIRPAAEPTTMIASETMAELSAMLLESDRVAILAGHGVLRAGATAELLAVAEKLGAPVATSRSGIGSVPTSHRLAVGMLGFYGTDAARQAISEAQTVLVVGCALGEQTTFGWRPDLFGEQARLIHADVDPSQVNRNYDAHMGITTDAKTLLASVAEALELETRREPWCGHKPVPFAPCNDASRGLSAAQFLEACNRRRNRDDDAATAALFSADIGNHRLWVCDRLEVTRPDGLLQSCEFDAMGFSLPAAIGASVARPGTKVVSISGDGGFVHTMGELSVAAELNLPVVAVVFVDGALGILRHQAEQMHGEDHFVRLAPIDFVTLADAFGVASRKVDAEGGLDDAVGWAMAADGPVLLVATIDPEEIFPPLLTKIEQRKRDLLRQ